MAEQGQQNPSDEKDPIDKILAEMDQLDIQAPIEKEPPQEEPEKEAPPEKETPPDPSPAPQAQVDDRIAGLLARIDAQDRALAELRQPRQPEPRRTPDRPEPAMEFVEVLGRRVPKDAAQRPIKISVDDLVALGWNREDGPAEVLGLLGNAFLGYVAELIPVLTMNQIEQRTRETNLVEARVNQFYTDFPDLKDHDSFVRYAQDFEMEHNGLDPRQFRNQQEYNAELGKRVQTRIASMRGLSLDQYRSQVRGSAQPAAARTPSRAVTTGSGARGTRQAPTRDELDDI